MTDKKSRLPLLEVDRVLPILNRIAVLGGLSELQLYKVFRLLEYTTYRKDEMVFQQGELPSQIYIVLSGSIHIVEDYQRTSVKLAEFNVGQCFGETSVIAIERHTASALVMEDTELLVLTRDALLSLYDEEPKLFGMLILNIAREACRRLNRTEETMLHYVMESNGA